MKLSTIITSTIDYLYLPLVAKFISIRTFRYGVCGVVNMALDLTIYTVLVEWIIKEHFFDLGFVVVSPHIASLIIVFPITFFNGFWLNKFIAFKHSPVRTHAQIVRYAMSVAIAILINYVVIKSLVEAAGFYPPTAKFIATCVATISSYLIQRYYTFKGSSE